MNVLSYGLYPVGWFSLDERVEEQTAERLPSLLSWYFIIYVLDFCYKTTENADIPGSGSK